MEGFLFVAVMKEKNLGDGFSTRYCLFSGFFSLVEMLFWVVDAVVILSVLGNEISQAVPGVLQLGRHGHDDWRTS